MFTVQVAVLPLRLASAHACSSKMLGLPLVRLSATMAEAERAI
jgi:hypothetical protein